MKRKIGLFFVAAVSVMCIAFGAAACTSDSNDRNDNDDKVINVVPTYQGMTISRDDTGTSKASTMSVAMTKEKPGNSGNGGDNGYNPWEDRPGWNPGDGNPHYDYDNEDKEEPEEDIEDIVDIDVVEDSEVRYYVDPGETFIIEVHLSNPSNYIIQSFTLNGKIYANYMFEDDSTLELLRLEVVAPTIPGYTEYTIDAIKYIDSNDNNTIKDAAFEGDKSVSAGVTYTSEPIATISSLKVGTTTADMIVALEDSQDVLGDAPVNFYLTKDDEVVYTSLLKKGSNSLSFDELLMGQTYQYGVGTYYDLIDGNGVCDHWLNTGSFVTQKSFAITNAAIYKTQVEFTVSKTGDDGEIKAIELIDAADEKVVSTLSDFTKTWFTDLLSNHEYKIKVSFSYESVGQTIEDSTAISFVTGAKTAPALELENVTADKDSISFTSAITDTDGILEIKSVNLIKDGKLIQSLEDLTMRKFEGLLSDAEYELVVNYSYDLNDGMGEHSATASTTVKTLAKAVPTVSIEGVTATQTDISFDISTVDTDDTLTIGAIVLSNQRGDIIQIQDVNSLVASGLLSDTEYEIKVNYTYDLNDGNGEHNMAVMAKGKTLAKVAPSVEIENIATTQTGVSFELETVDKDNILAIESVVLSNEEGKVAELESLDELSFSGLLSDNEYTITVNYSYDLNNGKGVQKATAIEIVKTIAKAVPTVNADFSDIQTDSLNGAVSFIDADIVGEVTSVEIYNANELVAAIDDYSQFNVSGLSAYTLYELRVQYSYDLNDGNGIQNDMAVFEVTTLPVFEFTSFKVINTSAVSEGEVIYIQANIYNPNGATFTSATINGKEYAVDPVSTTTYMYVQITNDGQFAGGETAIMVEKIVVTLDEAKYTILPEKDNTGKVFINGNLYADSISIVNNDKEATEYGYAGDKYYIQLNLTNPTGYEVYSVAYDGMYGDQTVTNGIIKGDSADIWYIPVDMYNGTNRITMKSIKYRNDYLDRETNVQLETHFYIAKGSEPVEVKTADDLLNMDEGYVYELKNDINLGGMQWDGGDFNGVFLGNGYAITNIELDIKNSFNQGFVSGNTLIGGIVGYEEAEGGIQNTYNYGKINGTSEYFGISSSQNIVLTTVHQIPEGITAIGQNAFYNVTQLKAVIIPETVVSIEQGAFSNCTATLYVVVNRKLAGWADDWNGGRPVVWGYKGNIVTYKFESNGGTEIGPITTTIAADLPTPEREGYIFLGWYTTPDFSGEAVGSTYYNPEGATFYAKWLDITLQSYGLEIRDGVIVSIGSCTDTELKIALPVGENAFESNENIVSVYFFESCTSIGEYAFNGCTNLKSVTFAENSRLSYLGSYAFSGCDILKEIELPCGLTEIPSYAFQSCDMLNTVILPDGVVRIADYAFANDIALIDIVIPSSIIEIGGSAFYYCNNLVSVQFMKGSMLERISWDAFSTTGISHFVIPEGVVYIGGNAFGNCSYLEYIVIPESVSTIDGEIFNGCNELTIYVELESKPSGWNSGWNSGKSVIWNYGKQAAYSFETNGGTSLQNISSDEFITLPIPEKTNNVFAGWYDNSDFLGEKLGKTYYNAQGATLYAKWIDISLQSNGLEITDGVITSIGTCNDTELKIALPVAANAFESNREIVSVYFISTCTSIGDYAFNGCSNLKSVTFAENSKLSYLGSYAFSDCDSLTEINLPYGLSSISMSVFQNCDALMSVMLPESITVIEDSAFESCVNLLEIIIPQTVVEIAYGAFLNCSSLTMVTFKDESQLLKIGAWAFGYDVNLTSIILPEGLTTIEYDAFSYCSNLEVIVIPISVSQIGSGLFGDCNKLTIYAEADSKPAQWTSGWNSGCSVVWGFGKTEVAYNFVSNGGTIYESVISNTLITLPVPERNGFVFGGWYDNAEFDGKVLNGSYYNAVGATLYAKWYDLNGFTQSQGLEIIDGVIVGVGTCADSVLTINMPVADYAFIECQTITKVIIGPCVSSLGYQAFAYCYNLKEVTFISEVPPQISQDVFGTTWDNSDFVVYVPVAALEDYLAVPDSYWQDYLVGQGKVQAM